MEEPRRRDRDPITPIRPPRNEFAAPSGVLNDAIPLYFADAELGNGRAGFDPGPHPVALLADQIGPSEGRDPTAVTASRGVRRRTKSRLASPASFGRLPRRAGVEPQKERSPGKGTGGRSSMEDVTEATRKLPQSACQSDPRPMEATSSRPGPPLSARPEAKQVSRSDPAECSHINRLPRKAARGRSGWLPRTRSERPIVCQVSEPEPHLGDPVLPRRARPGQPATACSSRCEGRSCSSNQARRFSATRTTPA